MCLWTGLRVAGLCICIVREAELSLVLKALLLSTSGDYLLICIGFTYIFLVPLRAAALTKSAVPPENPCRPPWYRGLPWSRGWPLLGHALLQLSVSALALAFFVVGSIGYSDLAFSACILFSILNTCTLRIVLRQSLQLLHARLSARSTRFRFRPFIQQYVASARRLSGFHATQHLAGFRMAPIVMEDQYRTANYLENGEGDSPAFLRPVEDSCTLVRLSHFRPCAETNKKLSKLESKEILQMYELPDESWELLVLKSYLPALAGGLGKVFTSCRIEPDSGPTEPSEGEGYENLGVLREGRVHEK
ncbi:uncharacterized protein BP5553_10492 [Venustampulla echinocandica]|uniref:Uncharacterized protein n=1 Tax=Venustampulla echinocandica TaxID=2656787 RepID=A0A370T9G3_9HELO|nr:uncharacterized protein BP5553_10492 [Venustampulla echinocandica]RDL30214.1 hypothetical protein BP5553_10492 [Venustampulla echinocandica]